MKLDVYFKDKEEFIKFIEDNISDEDILLMFENMVENANLEKDE